MEDGDLAVGMGLGMGMGPSSGARRRANAKAKNDLLLDSDSTTSYYETLGKSFYLLEPQSPIFEMGYKDLCHPY